MNNEPAFDEEPTTELPADQSTDWSDSTWDESDWNESGWEDEPDAVPTPQAAPTPERPIERFKKRRVVFGVAFLVLGLAGAITDIFNTDAGTALIISSLTGAVLLLGSLVLGARRNTNLFNQTPISHTSI